MRICFVFEGLFPGANRAARHVEAMARRFAANGHSASVVTTTMPGSRDPEEVAVLRLPHAPRTSSDKDEGLMLKTILRHLKQEGADLLFAESLTPLSAVAVKAARQAHIPTIVRVLSDRDGIVQEFGDGPRVPVKMVKKKIAALLEHASVVAASSRSCELLLEPYFKGPTRVIEKCVDLNVFRAGRTTRRDLDAFLAQHEAKGRRILLYARERLRESTPTQVLPLLPEIRRLAADVLFMVVGKPEGEGLTEKAADLGVADLVRVTGPLDGRDLFAAYEAASLFIVPRESRASARELLEAMAMRNGVVCYPETAAAASEVAIPGETALVLGGDDAADARAIGELLQDDERVAAMGERALEVARSHDLQAAIAQVEKLCQDVLGLQPEALAPRRPPPEAAPAAETPAGDEQEERGMGEREDDESEEMDRPADERRREGAPADRAGADRGDDDRGRRRRPERETEKEKEKEPDAGDDLLDEEGDEAASDLEEEVVVEGRAGEGAREPAREGGREGRRRDRRRRRRGRDEDLVDELGATTGIDVLEVPPDRERRRGGIDPGLTLKDLMPFLRPPKTVLILGASTGNGHARAAAAIAEGVRSSDRNLVARQIDMLDLVSKIYRAPYVRTFLEDLDRMPSLFGTPFETVEQPHGEELPSELAELLDKVFGEKLDQLVVDKRPDHVICTHWLPFRHFEKLAQEEKLRAKVSAVVCDPELHALWVSPVVTSYLVPDEAARTWLATRRPEATEVSISGIPVSPAFAEPVSRERVLRDLGLRSGNVTLLLHPAGIGGNERVVKVVTRMMDLGTPVNVLLVAGKNDRLREDAQKIEPVKGSTVKAFGTVENVHELMGAADLLITRPNSHTVAEAQAAGLAMVLLRPAPGMEQRVADRLLRRGVALNAYGEDDLDLILRELLRNRRQLRGLQEAAAAERRPDASAVAVDRILRVVR